MGVRRVVASHPERDLWKVIAGETSRGEAVINARVYGYLDDEGMQRIGGTITASGGRYDDIKAIQWDDGTTSTVGEHHRGWSWGYED